MKTDKTLKATRITAVVLILLYLIAIFGVAFDNSVTDYSIIIPTNLTALFILLLLWDKNGVRSWIYLALVFVAGFCIEAIGVNTGILFGQYEYLDSLGPKIFNTPILIGLNWALLIYCVADITNLFKIHWLLKALIGAGLMLIFDVALEPNAIRMEMWQWQDDSIPVLNFLTWFGFSFILLLPATKALRKPNHIAPVIFSVQLAFFMVLNLIFSYR